MRESVFVARKSLGGPYLIAEIGVNHENSMDTAHRMVEEVAAAGWHAAKFQTYKAETLASVHSPAYWDQEAEPAESQFKLFKRHDAFDRPQYEELADHCQVLDIDFLSTPFDAAYLSWLLPLMPAVKIASADITNLPLLEAVGAAGKPVILSTGASHLSEVRGAVDTLLTAGATDVVLLHCVLRYPTEPEHADLLRIHQLKDAFPALEVGYSDHVVPDPVVSHLAVAAALGATVIEKHFTLDRSLPGNDHYHAANPDDLRRELEAIQRVVQLLGSGCQNPEDHQTKARLYARRSIVAGRDLEAGDVVRKEDLRFKRPGTGISPTELDGVVGRRMTARVEEDTVLRWDHFESG